MDIGYSRRAHPSDITTSRNIPDAASIHSTQYCALLLRITAPLSLRREGHDKELFVVARYTRRGACANGCYSATAISMSIRKTLNVSIPGVTLVFPGVLVRGGMAT